MSQRQEGHEPRTGASDAALQTITDVARQGIERSDHTLAETGRAARIVDRSDLLVATLVVMHIFCPIAIGVLFLKQVIDGVIVDLLGVQLEGDRMPIVQADGSEHMRNLIELNTLPVDVADEEQFGLRVIDNMDRIVRTEILQDRNDDCSIGHRSEIDRYPIGVILTHHGDLVILLDAAFLKENMQFSNRDRQLAIGERFVGSIIGHSFLIPVFAERTLVKLNKVVFFFRHHDVRRFL